MHELFASAGQDCNRASFAGQTPNAVTGKWDGRDEEGNLILGEHGIRFWVPEPLRPNSIIVENAASKVLSVSADPYLIYHSYDQTTTLGLQLSTTAKVKVHILPPGELDIASAVETITLNNGNTLNAGTHTFTSRSPSSAWWTPTGCGSRPASASRRPASRARARCASRRSAGWNLWR